ncbi:MAG: glycosyltransferase [Clostridia bacterium]|nr:glycosyltransferase [Clostridia bacterium]
MIKVLMVISDTNIGGAGKWIGEAYRCMDKSRFQVKAVVPTNSKLTELYEGLGMSVIECDGIADQSFSKNGVKALYRIFRKEQPHIVHSHGTMSARIAAKLPFSHVKKVVYTRHSVFEPQGFFTTPFGKIINRILTALTSDRITAVCEAAKKNLTDTGVNPTSVTVVYNGVEPLPTPSPEQIANAKKHFGVSEEETVCSISARLNPVKGHRSLVEAVHKMKSRENMKFFIAGTGTEEEPLKKMVADYNLEDTIIFTGFLSNVSELLYATDVLLNCSYGTEACSLAILEAFSLGIPCIATDYGGNPELVKHEENGILYPTNDVAAFTKALERIQAQPDLIKQYGEQAKKTYESAFTVEIMTKNIEKVYEELL